MKSKVNEIFARAADARDMAFAKALASYIVENKIVGTTDFMRELHVASASERNYDTFQKAIYRFYTGATKNPHMSVTDVRTIIDVCTKRLPKDIVERIKTSGGFEIPPKRAPAQTSNQEIVPYLRLPLDPIESFLLATGKTSEKELIFIAKKAIEGHLKPHVKDIVAAYGGNKQKPTP